MAQLKYTKIELVRLKKKLTLFRKYLPTLQLKKMLLQAEVNKAKEELKKLLEVYEEEKNEALKHRKLLNDAAVLDAKSAFVIEEKLTTSENIAGIQVPVLERLTFRKPDLSLMKTPLWLDVIIDIIRKLKHSYEKVVIAEQKKQIMEKELRTVSIRVNLFEKRLLPELENDMSRIKIFLGDQELQSVSQAKVSKEKIIKRKLQKERVL